MELYGIFSGIRSHECKTCHKKFVLKEYLKSHERMHITQNQKLISCDLCSYKTFRPECMKTHKKTHFMRRDFQCKICERKFSQKHSLEYHQKLHERTRSKCRPAFVTKPSLFCKHCPKGFTTKRGLVRHTQKHIKGILPVLIPGGIAGKGDPQEENVENDVPLQPDHTAPQNCSEITKPHLSDKPKGKKRKRSELSAGETLPNENALNNNQNGTLGETGSLIKSTISNFSDMNIAEGIIVPADRHGMQVVNNEMLNALRWTVPDGRAENVHVPQVVVGNRGIGLQGGELYHTMSDVERLTAPVALAAPVRLVENAANISELMDRNNKMLREPVFGRESAFGLYAPPNMINIPESSATGIPPWASCRFSQPQDLTSKFGAAQGDFGINVTTSKFGTVQEEFGGNVGSKLHVVEANYKAEYNTSNQSNHSGNITALNDAPISLVRHEGDHDNAFDEDTDIENYDDDLQFDNTANDDNKVAIKKDSSENSKDDDFLCDVQCNKCSAKFFSFNQLKMHLMKGCGQSTCHK